MAFHALQTIENVKINQSPRLSLNYLDLQTIQKGWFRELDFIDQLWMNFNSLEEIPDEISQLIYLRRFSAMRNRIKTITPKLCLLQNMRALLLHHNCLTEIPICICRLVHLEELSLSHNLITKIPDEIGDLTKLQRLSLRNNQITELPGSIGNLRRVAGLFLNDNRITEIPVEFHYLKSLKWVSNKNNPLTPESRDLLAIPLPEMRESLRKKLVLSLYDSCIRSIMKSGKFSYEMFEDYPPKIQEDLFLESRVDGEENKRWLDPIQ
mmetsp:Transcript_27694/g.38523  ORF Transcript_27694/g.38523 Transcript_27694/m.38523 type:complete len:266 (+) Transcript_27694:49-846(+)